MQDWLQAGPCRPPLPPPVQGAQMGAALEPWASQISLPLLFRWELLLSVHGPLPAADEASEGMHCTLHSVYTQPLYRAWSQLDAGHTFAE